MAEYFDSSMTNKELDERLKSLYDAESAAKDSAASAKKSEETAGESAACASTAKDAALEAATQAQQYAVQAGETPTELADIRKDGKGKVYPKAGDAVRAATKPLFDLEVDMDGVQFESADLSVGKNLKSIATLSDLDSMPSPLLGTVLEDGSIQEDRYFSIFPFFKAFSGTVLLVDPGVLTKYQITIRKRVDGAFKGDENLLFSSANTNFYEFSDACEAVAYIRKQAGTLTDDEFNSIKWYYFCPSTKPERPVEFFSGNWDRNTGILTPPPEQLSDHL